MGKHGPMMLGGHRGMGENLATARIDGKLGVYPAFRENTIQSFQQAAKCGVGFVEFDVQVTRDNVPIIWHDDDVVLGPADPPSRPQVKDLTVAELQALCGRNRNLGAATHTSACASAPASSASSGSSSSHADLDDEGRKANSSASGSGSGSECASGADHIGGELLRRFRDRVTREWAKSYERWTCDQDDAIPTLEAVFSALPADVGFDIEVKMTTGDDVVHTPAEEVDRMLGAILPVVDRCTAAANTAAGASTPDSPLPLSTNLDHAAGSPDSAAAACGPMGRRRQIMFSSFDPDVCKELRRRQAAHPVYYLSGCGLYEHADVRRTSIPAALTFAAEAGMQGIVVPASVLLKNMDMVASAGRSHLELMTYGLENNDLDCLRAQADAGVTAAIVDEVAGVTAALGPSPARLEAARCSAEAEGQREEERKEEGRV